MKKIILLIGISSLFFACTNVTETEEYKSLQNQNDSLVTVSSNQNNEVLEYLMDFNSIQENLNLIKEKENIITLNKGNNENKSKREQIKDDINTIYELLNDNKNKLEALNKKYNSSKNKNKKLQKLIETLNVQIVNKNTEIQALNMELKSLNFEIKDLTDELIAVQGMNEKQAAKITSQKDELQTAYYVVGSIKELKEHKIVTKNGGFIGIGRNTKLDDNFDKEYFTEINTVSFNEISLYSKSAKLITTHPKGSYKLEGSDKKTDKLIIIDSEKFWSVSKYLVIEVKN